MSVVQKFLQDKFGEQVGKDGQSDRTPNSWHNTFEEFERPNVFTDFLCILIYLLN